MLVFSISEGFLSPECLENATTVIMCHVDIVEFTPYVDGVDAVFFQFWSFGNIGFQQKSENNKTSARERESCCIFH